MASAARWRTPRCTVAVEDQFMFARSVPLELSRHRLGSVICEWHGADAAGRLARPKVGRPFCGRDELAVDDEFSLSPPEAILRQPEQLALTEPRGAGDDYREL